VQTEQQITAAIEQRFMGLQALIIIDDVDVLDHPLLGSDRELGFVGRPAGQWRSCCVVTSTHDPGELMPQGGNLRTLHLPASCNVPNMPSILASYALQASTKDVELPRCAVCLPLLPACC
jgi:hypothetical protein